MKNHRLDELFLTQNIKERPKTQWTGRTKTDTHETQTNITGKVKGFAFTGELTEIAALTSLEKLDREFFKIYKRTVSTQTILRPSYEYYG